VSAPASSRTLTRRQLEVLRLVANGHTVTSAGRVLGIERSGAATLLVKAFRHLGVHDRAHAVAVALRLGLIGLDEIRLPDPVAPSRALAGSVAAELLSGARGEPAVAQRGAGDRGAERAGSAGGMRR
jgi:DNA-binding CsgD family transcriptional regulator